jgi:hypothetical protein
MKKNFFTIIIFFFFLSKVSAQIEVHSSNQVGIGTTNPEYKLHVVGDAFITGNVTGNFYLRSDSNFFGTTGNYPVIFKANNILSGSTGNSDNTNVSFGYEALLNPGLSNPYNTAIGYRALRNSAEGNGYNTAIGTNTLYSNTTGSYNTAIGSEALRSNSGGSNNIANGHNTLYSNTTGNDNIAVGSNVLYNNTTGNYNTAIGSEALRSNSGGSYNIANGHNALYNNTTGSYNIAIGGETLRSNLEGNDNIANGRNALYKNTIGSNNTAIGSEALRSNSEGNYNIANGRNALYSNTSGNNNIAIGNDVLYNNTTGSYNTAVGVNAGIGFRSFEVINNSTAIGFQAPITASNQVRIGNNTITSIGGSVSWSNLSDGRAAKSIQNNVPGLSFINNLQPVTYNMDLDALDELALGGKRLLSQLQIGETLGGNRIIFDTSKNLGKRLSYPSSFIISGENGWKLSFRYVYHFISTMQYHYIEIYLLDPSDVVIENIYYSRANAIGAANEQFIWQWYKSEILVPLDFGIITSMVEDAYPIGFFGGIGWKLSDAWVLPPESQALDNIQLQARSDKELQVQSGFVAQDVETAAQSVGYDFSGVDVDNKGIYSLRYSEFVVPLVKAVQELSEQNRLLQEQINALKSRVEDLENE